MKHPDIKYFGLLSSLVSGIVLMLLQLIFKFDVVLNSLGKLPIYVWAGIVVAFLLFTLFNAAVARSTLNWIYFIMAIASFLYLNSMFQWSVECCPENYDSMYDWNASKGMAWMVFTPLTFAILLVLGLAYDILHNWKRNTGSMKKSKS